MAPKDQTQRPIERLYVTFTSMPLSQAAEQRAPATDIILEVLLLADYDAAQILKDALKRLEDEHAGR